MLRVSACQKEVACLTPYRLIGHNYIADHITTLSRVQALAFFPPFSGEPVRMLKVGGANVAIIGLKPTRVESLEA